jgi:hypothetical protein
MDVTFVFVCKHTCMSETIKRIQIKFGTLDSELWHDASPEKIIWETLYQQVVPQYYWQGSEATWRTPCPPLTTFRVCDVIQHDYFTDAETKMTQDADEGQEGVGHPGTDPPELEGWGVVTHKAWYRHQGEALPCHQQGAEGTLEWIAGVRHGDRCGSRLQRRPELGMK